VLVDIKGGKGPASTLFINDKIPIPQAKETQAIVKIKCFGLNRMDLIQREGNYPLPPQAGAIMGVEFSGIIQSIAPGSERGFKVGDEVFGLAYGGAYAEYIAVSTHMLIHKPTCLSWEQAAGIPETWITATQALYLIGKFSPGKSVLWHAGASSVSIAGQQLSKAEGASKIFATARSAEKCNFCIDELGATDAFLQTGDWAEDVLKATDGKGVDIIIDFIGAPTFGPNLKALAKDGACVTLGAMGGTQIPAGVDIGMLVYKRIRYQGSTLRSRDEDYQGKLRDQLVEHALPKFEDGSFKVFIEKVFDMEQIREAHELLESNKTKGKLICRVS
jgi:NADPH:quinone reductase-like Zn-dependent oxidoreductase